MYNKIMNKGLLCVYLISLVASYICNYNVYNYILCNILVIQSVIVLVLLLIHLFKKGFLKVSKKKRVIISLLLLGIISLLVSPFTTSLLMDIMFIVISCFLLSYDIYIVFKH